MERRKLRPLKVTAHLDSLLAGDAPMLDALLECVLSFHMSAIGKTSGGHRHLVDVRARGEPVSEPGKVPIPIARRMVGGLPIPLCSSPILSQPYFDGVEYVTKALCLENSHLLRPDQLTIVSTTGEWTKSYRLPLRVRGVESVTWFCVANDEPARVRKLVKQVHAIGKKVADGYGIVAGWTVDECERDLSWFAESEQGPVLMRPLPACAGLPDGLKGYRRDFGAPCPPYWQRSLYTELLSPA